MSLESDLSEAKSPETPFSRLKELSEHDSIAVRRALVDNVAIALLEDGSFTDEILVKLAGEFPDEVAQRGDIVFFFEVQGLEVRKVAEKLAESARDSELTAYLFGAWQMDPVISLLLAQNPCTPPDVLDGLAGHNEWFIRRAVAKNPNTRQQTRGTLGSPSEADWWVRQTAGQPPSAVRTCCCDCHGRGGS